MQLIVNVEGVSDGSCISVACAGHSGSCVQTVLSGECVCKLLTGL